MKNGIFGSLGGGLIVLMMAASPSIAENKIVALLDPTGKVMFTNNVDNASIPASTVSVPLRPLDAPSNDPIHSLIESISANHGVDPALVRAMIQTESNYNRWAISSKGALGLMQLIPNTGTRFGVRDFFDPKQNIEGGVRYMKFLLQKFNGDLDLSLAAYNAGESLVERIGRIPSIPETRDYVRKVRSQYGKPSATAASNQRAVEKSPTAKPAESHAAAAQAPRQEIFRTVDERGIVHFSNVAPPK